MELLPRHKSSYRQNTHQNQQEALLSQPSKKKCDSEQELFLKKDDS
jgi:hypothetical protein